MWLCPRRRPRQTVCSRPSLAPHPCPRALLPTAPESPPMPALPLTTLPAAPRPGTCNLQCFNGGSCFLNARRQPKCRCQPRYTGDKCELDQCWEHCRNGGTCAASPSGMAFGSPARTPGPWALLPPSRLCPALLHVCCPPPAAPNPSVAILFCLPPLCCLPPARPSQPCSPAVGPGSSVGHSPAHTSSPARHAHVPVPHRLHGPQMHPAGVCRLLCQQQHLHGQPGQPAPVPMPARLPGGSLPVP